MNAWLALADPIQVLAVGVLVGSIATGVIACLVADWLHR